VAGKVAVVGAGSWGTTVAALLAARVPVTLWARRPEVAAEIAATRRNSAYTGDVELPEGLVATSDLREAVEGAQLLVMAVPSHGFRETLAALEPALSPGTPVVSLTKGLEQHSLLRMTEVVAQVAPGRPTGVLTGPNLAREVLAGQPTAAVVAMADLALARELQQLFWSDTLRVYTNADVTGCEIAGAVKNVLAIAAGMARGLGLGDNTRAAVVTRSLAELARLGSALGGDPLTFSGLAGLGDLVATCTSEKSRNFALGVALGRGMPLADALSATRMVAEGVRTSAAVVELARRVGVEVPICEEVVAVCFRGKPPAATITSLMRRAAKDERHGFSGTRRP
jgi:glycerol-3-phosphate dehydrogenase (NAD(P)+)